MMVIATILQVMFNRGTNKNNKDQVLVYVSQTEVVSLPFIERRTCQPMMVNGTTSVPLGGTSMGNT